MDKLDITNYQTEDEQTYRTLLGKILKASAIPENQLYENLGLFMTSKTLARILFFNHIYQQILTIPGQIFEFGTRWGNSIGLLHALRAVYEPYNRHRTIVAMDTFEGFPTIHQKDGHSDMMKAGLVSTTTEYEKELKAVLSCLDHQEPLAHILDKNRVIKGDVLQTLPQYFQDHPETIIAFAYLDLDLYEPTKFCLEQILPRMPKGAIIGFDELNDGDSPGETMALQEVLGISNVALKRFPLTARCSYLVL